MIEDQTDLTPEALDNARANGNTILGFNEPELKLHANMSVESVLNAWPLLQRTGLRLGAPAVAGSADVVDSWFYQFMSGARSHRYRVDFIPLHWYVSPQLKRDFSITNAVDDLHQYLENVYARYKLPIWLTEFSLITWSSGDGSISSRYVQEPAIQAEFLGPAITMMRSLPWLERWAWYSLTPTWFAPGTAMFDDESRITEVGRKFRDCA